MAHDTNKVLMGTTGSSEREISNAKGTVAAGVRCTLKSDGTLSNATADGAMVGISVGRDLSGTDKTSYVRRGLMVPMQLTAAFNPTAGTVVHISDTTGLAIASGAGATATNAVYKTGRVGGSGVNAGQQEDGTTVGVAYIDMPGGL